MYFLYALKAFVLSVSLCFTGISYAKNTQFLVLNYHDIVAAEDVEPANSMDLNVKRMEEQWQWLKKNGYQVISVQNVLDAAAGKISLPAKSVMLTFDDGYLSFYSRVFPLLKKYHYPATVALVGKWMEGKEAPDEPGKQLMNWAQVNELAKSDLIEIASHSYDLHVGAIANPYGNTQAAATTRVYDDPMLRYEPEPQYRERIYNSLRKSADFILQHTGKRPRVMVWPYGEYNETTLAAAREAGMPITMGLVDGLNTLADMPALRRLILMDNPDLKQFSSIVNEQRSNLTLRVAHVDIDYVYDTNAKQMESNIDMLIERINDMNINTVFLQAYADPDGDGNATALYFPNRHLPVKQDLFNRIAWQLKRRADVKVYAWMPIMAYQGDDIPKDWYVQEWRNGKAQAASHIYTRLSPFNAEARAWVADIYEDLGRYCNFDGVLFHDDGILSDFEDVTPLALNYTHEVWNLPAQFDALHATPAMRLNWAQHKTELINQFTDELAHRVRINRPGIKTARNMYALPILTPNSEEWFAQSLGSFLNHYDYVAIEAMPLMEEAKNPTQWLTDLTKAVSLYPDGLKKTLFELQAVDWRSQKPITSSMFIDQLTLLKKLGAQHLGYYPDNVFENQPHLSDLQQHFSVPDLP